MRTGEVIMHIYKIVEEAKWGVTIHYFLYQGLCAPNEIIKQQV